MKLLLKQIRECEVCKVFLPNEPRPILQASAESKIVIIGQAPGRKVDETGVPWDDASGEELRRWLGVSRDEFYESKHFALVPMGFCYPGKGKSGDLPPRPECAPLWHHQLLAEMKSVQLTLLIGHYSQRYYLGDKFRSTLTENIQNYAEFLPRYLPLVHPSPRNRIWQKKNPWFEQDVIPKLKEIVRKFIS